MGTPRRVTLKDIAKVAGVSSATVSMALNGKGSLTPLRREAIKKLAKDMGYVPSSIARALRGEKTQLVGVVNSDISSPMFRDFFSGLEETLYAHGLYFMASQSMYSLEKEKFLVSKMLEQGICALLIEPCFHHDPYLLDVAAQIPVIQVLHRQQPELAAVRSDNRFGGELVTRHLFELEGRQVVHVSGTQGLDAFDERMKGFQKVYEELCPDKNPEEAIFHVRGIRYEEGFMIMPSILEKFSPPLSIFATNDMIALGMLQYCRQVGLHVPDDVAVAGFCNIEQLGVYGFPLTSVNFSKRGMGEAAGNLVLEQIRAHKNAMSVTIDLPVSLVIRSSTTGQAGPSSLSRP